MAAGVQLALFFGEMGQAAKAAEMYETILAQPPSVLNASLQVLKRALKEPYKSLNRTLIEPLKILNRALVEP